MRRVRVRGRWGLRSRWQSRLGPARLLGGNLGQLTSSELTDAIKAAEVLYKLGEYFERMTYVRISTLRADLEVEREDRQRATAEVTAEAKASA